MRAAEAGGISDFTGLALAATRAAALSCAAWVGRGSPKEADGAATDAMREVLAAGNGRGTVVVGEGAKDEAPMLYHGERLGKGGRQFDIAVDPLECTDLCAKGLPGALATIAISTRGAMAGLGPSFYMDKLVAGRAARDALSIESEPEDNLEWLSTALDKPDPLAAIHDAMSRRNFDEIVVSTLPHRVSRWLRMDLPSKARGLGLPVAHVEAEAIPEPALAVS